MDKISYGDSMYRITGQKQNNKLQLEVKTMGAAMRIADEKIEEGYIGVKIEITNDQLPLFEGEYYENR